MVEKYFQKGVIKLMDSNHYCTKGLSSVREIIKQYLTLLHVPFYDDLDVDKNVVPLRYNTTTEEVEYYDYATETWLNLLISGGDDSDLIAYRSTNVSGDYLITDRVLEVIAPVTITMNFVPVVGVEYNVKNSSIGVVTVAGGAYTIDGASFHNIPVGEARTLFFNGTQFIIY